MIASAANVMFEVMGAMGVMCLIGCSVGFVVSKVRERRYLALINEQSSERTTNARI